MGKSGHVAGKIAATLASTGTPSFFVHPAELAHGDFGMLTEEDLVLAISNSGETGEVTAILPPIKRRRLPLIGMTSDPSSTLARYSDIVLDLCVQREACPLELAPTCSTTASLALGDAIAVALMEKRRFTVEDFARFHPGGSLGRKLIKVDDVMRDDREQIPIVRDTASYQQVLQEITDKKLGFTCVTDSNGRLAGMVTDGDLRRAQIRHGGNCYQHVAADIMNPNPKVTATDTIASEALKIMEDSRISNLVVLDGSGVIMGVVDLKDLLKTGLY
jgi:arabinose-5-phosphate isomerase